MLSNTCGWGCSIDFCVARVALLVATTRAGVVDLPNVARGLKNPARVWGRVPCHMRRSAVVFELLAELVGFELAGLDRADRGDEAHQRGQLDGAGLRGVGVRAGPLVRDDQGLVRLEVGRAQGKRQLDVIHVERYAGRGRVVHADVVLRRRQLVRSGWQCSPYGTCVTSAWTP
jgi:hypothetical protein